MKWIFFILLLANTILSQGRESEMKKYHQLINKAELAIVDGSYEKAISCYDSAFLLKKNPFAQDLYNAGICAVKLNQVDKANEYCMALADKGVGAEFFKNNIAYQHLNGSEQWDLLILRAMAKRDDILSRNSLLLKTIDSLVVKDQKVNNDWHNSGMADRERQTMDLTYDTIQAQLLSIFKETGFISEDMIGAQLTEFGTLAYRLPFDVIMIHNYQSRMKGDTLFKPMLKQALEDGLIKPEYLATIEDFGSSDYSRPYYGSSHFYIQYHCTIYLESSNLQRLTDIEKARADIGLCTTQEQLKKVIFAIQNPGNDFRILSSMSKIGSFGDKDSEQRMLANSTVVFNTVPNCKN